MYTESSEAKLSLLNVTDTPQFYIVFWKLHEDRGPRACSSLTHQCMTHSTYTKYLLNEQINMALICTSTNMLTYKNFLLLLWTLKLNFLE